MSKNPPSFKEWEDPRTGLIFSCPEDWQVSATDLGIVMICARFGMLVTIKVFRIAGFGRSDDPRLYQRFVAYLHHIKPDLELKFTQDAEWADEVFGKRGVQLHSLHGRFKCSIFLGVQGDFLVALWAEWAPDGNHDGAIATVLRQVFASLRGKLNQANKLYALDEPEPPPVFARADLDNRLIGRWCYESYTSVPSLGHADGFSYSSSRWLALAADGRFAQGSSLATTMHHYDSTGDMTGTSSGLTEGQGDRRGAWRADGKVLRLDFDEGTYVEYQYQVWTDGILLTTAKGKETYWKRCS